MKTTAACCKRGLAKRARPEILMELVSTKTTERMADMFNVKLIALDSFISGQKWSDIDAVLKVMIAKNPAKVL